MAFLGTSLGRALIKYITDNQFQTVTRALIFGLGIVYLYQGVIEVGDADKIFDSLQDKFVNLMARGS